MPERVRALSASAASECENAKHPQCKCRCGGKMHGAARGSLSGLPLDDPHSPSLQCKKCGGTGENWGYNEVTGQWDENAKCGWCKGEGRLIKPSVLKELTKIEGAPDA